MIVLEILTWMVLATVVAAIQAMLADEGVHPWRYLVAASLAALLGGITTRFSSVNNWVVGGYSVSSLLAAGFFALAAVIMVVSLAPRRWQRAR
jgi:hypothetical protein